MTGSRAPIVAATVVAAVAVALVALTLRQPDVVTFAPTAPAPHAPSRALVGPVTYTVDATAADAWRAFSFARGATVDGAGDLLFRRYAIVAGPGAAVADLGAVGFDEARTAPAEGYQANEGRAEPRNPAIAGWYRYGFFSHVLTPRPHVWAVRTAEGRYAKLEILSYYCPGPQPGCLTFRYVFQGDGSRRLAP